MSSLWTVSLLLVWVTSSYVEPISEILLLPQGLGPVAEWVSSPWQISPAWPIMCTCLPPMGWCSSMRRWERGEGGGGEEIGLHAQRVKYLCSSTPPFSLCFVDNHRGFREEVLRLSQQLIAVFSQAFLWQVVLGLSHYKTTGTKLWIEETDWKWEWIVTIPSNGREKKNIWLVDTNHVYWWFRFFS